MYREEMPEEFAQAKKKKSTKKKTDAEVEKEIPDGKRVPKPIRRDPNEGYDGERVVHDAVEKAKAKKKALVSSEV